MPPVVPRGRAARVREGAHPRSDCGGGGGAGRSCAAPAATAWHLANGTRPRPRHYRAPTPAPCSRAPRPLTPAPSPRPSPPHPAQDATRPAWGWFSVSNVLAAGVFMASMTHLMSFWLANNRAHSPAFAFAQPGFALAVLGAVSSLLYFIAFCGVAFIASDVELLTGSASAAGEDASTSGAAAVRDMDSDVVIVGAGTAGATMAAVLARQGKTVTLIERCVPAV